MGNYKPIVALSLGVVISLVVTLYIWSKIKHTTGIEKPAERATATAVVAATDIPRGTSLTDAMLTTKEFLKVSLPPSSFHTISDLSGRVTLNSIKSGELLFSSDLIPIGSEKGVLAAVIASEKRAMAIKIDKFTGVGGFIAPGNRVDVYITVTDQIGNSKKGLKTKIVFENILVLAVGTELAPDETDKNKGKKVPDVIVLEVTPEQGEKLALTHRKKGYHLALRSNRDDKEIFTEGADIPRLLGLYSFQEPIEEPEFKTEPEKNIEKIIKPKARHSIELIRGNEIKKIEF
ncbi:MAG: Flp pilus assembly protein CpaB [bacterium]